MNVLIFNQAISKHWHISTWNLYKKSKPWNLLSSTTRTRREQGSLLISHHAISTKYILLFLVWSGTEKTTIKCVQIWSKYFSTFMYSQSYEQVQCITCWCVHYWAKINCINYKYRKNKHTSLHFPNVVFLTSRHSSLSLDFASKASESTSACTVKCHSGRSKGEHWSSTSP